MSRAQAAKKAQRPTREDFEEREVFKFVDEGDEVYGVVTRVAFGLGRNGDVNLIEVDDEDHGEITVFLGNMGLEQGLVDGGNNLNRPVQKGDTVYIRFDELEDLDGGKTFKHFSIFLESGGGKKRASKKAAPSGAHEASEEDDEELPF